MERWCVVGQWCLSALRVSSSRGNARRALIAPLCKFPARSGSGTRVESVWGRAFGARARSSVGYVRHSVAFAQAHRSTAARLAWGGGGVML